MRGILSMRGEEFGVDNILKLLEKINKEKKMNELERQIDSYKMFINDYSKFIGNLESVIELNLDIWLKIAKLYELPVKRVLIKEAFESFETGIEETALEDINIPEMGKINVSNNRGTVIFVDISRSTDFFEEKFNYTSFVIFNSYISLIKTYVRLSGGEFLEHTGDGSMIFYNDDFISNYNNGVKSENKLKKHSLDIMFYIGYLLQNKSKEKGLLGYSCKKGYAGILGNYDRECYSLVHIGAAYGEVLDVNLGDMRKLISDVVWKAANNCKNSPRYFVKNFLDGFEKLPIKI